MIAAPVLCHHVRMTNTPQSATPLATPMMAPPAVLSPTRTNTLALVGFIAAFFMPVVGIVLGTMAKRQIAQTGEAGRGLAQAAFIVGIVGTAFQVLFFMLWLAGVASFFLAIPR